MSQLSQGFPDLAYDVGRLLTLLNPCRFCFNVFELTIQRLGLLVNLLDLQCKAFQPLFQGLIACIIELVQGSLE